MTDRAIDPQARDAIDIYQEHLDVSTRLVFEGAAEAYGAHAQLPFVFRTGGGVEVIETAADMAADIRQIHHWLRSKGVTDYHRIARSARYLDPDTIEGFHVTYALQGAIQILQPYASRMILRQVDGAWKTSFAEHELREALYPGHDARAQHGLFAEQWARAPSALTREQCQAQPLYQSRLDIIAEAVNADRFEDFLANYHLPYQMHRADWDDLAVDAARTRKLYGLLHEQMRELGADRIVLASTSATFLADDRLLGYHTASLMRGDEVRFGPVRSRIILTDKGGGDWRVKSIADALATSGLDGGELKMSPNMPTLREIEKRTKT
jgi:hypothetical protein